MTARIAFFVYLRRSAKKTWRPSLKAARKGIRISRLLCGKNMALTEEQGMEKNFQKLNGELRFGTRPSEKCLIVYVNVRM